MNKEILIVAQTVSNEKGVDPELIFEAVEAALETATRDRSGMDIGVRIAVDRKTGDYETFRYWDVIDEDFEILEFPDRQLNLEDAKKQDDVVEIGGRIEEPMQSIAFSRIAAQKAKQMIVKKVREAERALVVEAYKDRVGDLLTGSVKRVTRDNVVFDLGNNAEALLPREHALPREAFRLNDRVRAYLHDVHYEPRGAQLFVSRICPEMLIELFKIEVPEIGEEVIEIKGGSARSRFARQNRRQNK